MSVNSKMTAIADEVRALSGTTGALGLDDMASQLNTANGDVTTQISLIEQIQSALRGKAAGGTAPADPVLQEKTVDPTTSTQTVTPDSNYDGLSKVTVNAMPTATQATPTISLDASGKITASVSQSAGYLAAGTKTATQQLPTQAAKTVTPSTSSQTAVASGVYTTGAITVAAVPTQTKSVTPSASSQNITPDSGKFLSSVTVNGDSNLVADNIKSGVSIFGVSGSYEGSGSGDSGGGSDSVDESALVKSILDGSVTSIDSSATKLIAYALRDQKSLTTVNLPQLTNVATSVFNGCSALKTINVPKLKTTGTYTFANCTALTELELPSATSLTNYCCQNCAYMTIIDLKVASSIGQYVFQGCRNLTTLILRNTSTVATLTNVNSFTSIPIANGTGYIYVPASLIESYKTATNWSTYAAQFRAIEDYPEICG